MKNFKVFALLLVSLAFLFASCKDSKNKEEPKIPIKKVTASSEINISEYSDVVCSINSVEYQFAMSGKTVTATPREGGEVAYTIPFDEGLAAVTMFLINPNIASGGIIDQSSFKKMLSHDVLHASKVMQPNPTSEVTGLTLEHYHSMLSFTCKNISEGATIKVKEGSNYYVITPYKSEDNIYQAVAVYALGARIEVTENGVSYEITVGGRPQNKSSVAEKDSNNFYTFEIEFHPQEEDPNQKLTLNDVKKVKWENQHFE